MSSYTENSLGFILKNDDYKILENKNFQNNYFEELEFGPSWPPGKLKLTNLNFSKCNVTSGRFCVGAGVNIENVVFDSIKSRDFLTISTHAVLKNVVIKGKYPKKGIWVRPDEVFNESSDSEYGKWAKREYEDIECILDITSLDVSEILIYGFPIEKIKFDSKKHIVLKRSGDPSAINRIEIPGGSGYFRAAIRKLYGYGVSSAIVGLPLGDNEYYLKTVEELRVLRLNGIID